MKTISLLIVTINLLMPCCNNKKYIQIAVDNPEFKPNTVFSGSEDLTSPKFNHLIEKYQLDTVFQGETDELSRILLLRHWIKSKVRISDFEESYPGEGDVEKMLDYALSGQGYHCGHYMKIQNAIMNAYGYVTRTLGAGPGVKGGPDGYHGINEIWLNDFNKWFLSDAKYDHHFEKNGIPLSAMQIRDEYLKNKAAEIVVVKGPDRIITEIDPETGTKRERRAQTYTWVEFHGYNNMFTAWPAHKEMNIMQEDDFTKNNIWFRDGNPHWAYEKPEYRKWVKNRDDIEWTPNTINSNVEINRNKVSIKLMSNTPNLSRYEMKDSASGIWQQIGDSIEINLNKSRYVLIFRTANIAGVTGPEHKIILSEK
ncbi:transglutaminase domain-containing protein [Proteiniphilum saccharofermentans]|nr:transglutaminase domain-containing protein [Proteiniphilum saccharofermentans]